MRSEIPNQIQFDLTNPSHPGTESLPRNALDARHREEDQAAVLVVEVELDRGAGLVQGRDDRPEPRLDNVRPMFRHTKSKAHQ